MTALVRGAIPRDGDSPREVEKRDSLVKLRDEYSEARELAPSLESHTNLEWILGARRDTARDPLRFDTKAVEVVALWLQDLAGELDRHPAGALALDVDEATSPADEDRRFAARKLRDATERFLAAFRRRS